jgi:serine/threonine-protein kinase
MADGEFSGMMFGQQYEIQEFLDDNGIIHTYRAFQTSLDRPVAVHVLAPGYRSDPYWPQAFINGAEIAAQYAHPNIVPVFDHGLHENVDYIVLRLMEGGTLGSRLEEGPLEIPEAVSTVKQIAAALDYVHSQGSCHGDPATVNIDYDTAGNAYVADFYLMGLLQIRLNVPIIAGVPAFLPPERMRGEFPTPFSDQYSLAGVSYNMLTGKLPWDAPARSRQPETIAPPQTHRAEIPIAVNDVLIRALARDPQERFPTIMEFARQFEIALKESPQHVFISYSQHDKEYVQRLKTYLQENNLQVWFDERIEHGDHWFNDINEAIKSSPAVIVVMSPDAEQSEWVHKEILLAKRYRKPIFPLLLRGEELPILIDLQFEDVRTGDLPGTDFHRRIARAVYGV